MCGHTVDKATGNWRKRFNIELRNMAELAPVANFVKRHCIQCLGHVMMRIKNEK